MEIRLATLDDIKPICGLYNEFFAYNARLQPQYCRAGKEKGAYPKATITSDNSDIFLAVEDGVAVGFIHVRQAQTPPFDSIVPHKYAEIIDFFVSAAHRKKGIGGELIDAAKRWSKARSLDYIELLVLSNAEDANRFYRRKDFATVSHTMRYPLTKTED